MKKKKEKPTHVDTVVNNMQPLTLTTTNVISNKHNNQIPQVDCFAINLSKYSYADQDVISDEICYEYDFTTSYLTYSVVFQGSKLRISIKFSKDNIMAPSTHLNGSSSSVISVITTLFSSCNINRKYFQ